MLSPGSEVAALREQIAAQHTAAKLGLQGLSAGTARHSFITARQERIGALHEQLQGLVGDRAMALVAETLDAVPDIPTRVSILAALRYGLEQSERGESLCNDLQQVWKTIDLLKGCLGDEQVRKLIFAPSSSVQELVPS
jgi:hypothetical protein